LRFSNPGAINFICMDWRLAGEMLAGAKNICVWVKHNGGMGTFYRSQHELIFLFKMAGRLTATNIQLGKHGRYRTNVWSPVPQARRWSLAAL
jgi:hypothetical protein